eukprot:TRINITY_DN21649_c0_g1_i1.p1 TRINITY_DN21649_c0_g1~~TRINITY_DN21649_c0_g1_i1.p1  ORF type:complete len:118 (-),score=30.03 TRINITY_DN21649_c0_g1_i1:105-458(-)
MFAATRATRAASSYKPQKVTKLRPLFDRVLVEKAEAPKQSAGGIVLPESMRPKTNYGKVVEVGQGRRNDKGALEPLVLKVGDYVMLSDWGGNTVKIEEKEYQLVREDDVLGTVELSE